MLKRERTCEDKQFDIMLKRSIMRLGETPPPDDPNPFRYYLAWDIQGRKGQKLRILKLNGKLKKLCLVQFADGFETVLNRQAVRQFRGI